MGKGMSLVTGREASMPEARVQRSVGRDKLR